MIVGLLVISGAMAGTVPYELQGVRAEVVARALQVERARLVEAQARAGARGAVAEALPSVVGLGSTDLGGGMTGIGFARGTGVQRSVGIAGNWTLLSPADWGAIGAARHEVVATSALLAWAEVDARRVATVSVAEVWAAQTQQELAVTTAEDARRAAVAVDALTGAGLRPAADAARFHAEAIRLEAERHEADARVVARCSELQALLGVSIDGDCAVAPPTWGEPVSGPESHPALDAAAALVRAARSEAVATTGARAPSLSAGAGVAWYDGPQATGSGWSAGLGLTVPLVAGGAGLADGAQARAGVALAQLDLDDQERALRVALVSAEARLAAARRTAAARVRAEAAAREALALVQARYDAGVTELVALLEARRARDAAATAVVRTEADLGGALAEVEAARGVGGG